MNWIKDHLLLSISAVIAICAMGIFSYLAIGASQQVVESISTYNNDVRQIDSLRSQVPFPNKTNVDALTESVDKYRSELNTFKHQLSALDEPASTASPQTFQDDLRKAVDEISALALKNFVALPEEFYLGFDEFRTRLPSKEETPALYREFKVLKSLVNQLIALKVASINSLNRLPSSPITSDNPSPISKRRFDLSFTGEQKDIIVGFNTISRFTPFLVIRSASFENSNPLPPQKSSPDQASAAPRPAAIRRPAMADLRGREQAARRFEAPPLQPRRPGLLPTAAPSSEDSHLHVVLGNEVVSANMLVEILTFPETEAENQGAKEPNP